MPISAEELARRVNDISFVTKCYLKKREEYERIQETAKKDMTRLKEEMRQLGQHMLDLMGTTDLQRTGDATVSRVIKQKFWSTDWKAFEQFVVETDNLGLFERRIAQKNMAEYLAKNPDKVPAGLQIDRRYDVLVRRLPKKPE